MSHDTLHIMCQLTSLDIVQQCLMSCGYGKASVLEQSDLSVHLQITHDQLDTPENMQRVLRSTCMDHTIIVRP